MSEQHKLTGLTRLAVRELLILNGGSLEELRRRGVVRSTNNPVGDYAELLFCRAFGWQQAGNSQKDADAIGADGARYQIKARRTTQRNASRQLGALRRLPERGFDTLAAVLFTETFSVDRGCLVPHELVLKQATYRADTNSWRFILRDDVWRWPGVRDVSADLRRAQDNE